MSEIFLDIETTHLNPKRSAILSISIITDWDNGQQDVWTTKIQPRDLEIEYASPDALKICNYKVDDWDDAPFLEDVAETTIRIYSILIKWPNEIFNYENSVEVEVSDLN